MVKAARRNTASSAIDARRTRRPARAGRLAFRPGLGASMERLEERRLLDGSGDLTQQISSLIQAHATGAHSLSNVSLGSFLTIPSATVTLSGISQQDADDWSGSVTVSAAGASLAIGASLTGSITPATSGGSAISGSYTLNDQPLNSGSYALTAGNVDVTVPGALDVKASGVAVNYSPTEAAGSTIFTLNSASGTILPLANAALSISNLAVRDNGFTLDDATVTAGAINLGGVVSVASPTASFRGVSYTAGSPVSGTIGVSAASAALFPGNARLSASLTNFAGTDTLGTGALTLGADSGEVAVGHFLDAKATSIGLTWDGTTAAVDLKSASLTSPLFPGASASVSDFHGDNTGFTLGRADLTTPEAKLGGVLDIQNLDLGVSNLSYVASSGALSGTFGVGAGAVSILPGASLFTSSVAGFAASYDLGSDAVSASATSAAIKVGSTLEVDASNLGFSLTPASESTPYGVSASVGSATATMPDEGVSGTLAGLAVTSDGFRVASGTLTGPASTSAFGGKFSIASPSVSLANLSYSVSAGAKFSGDLTLTTPEVDFNPGPSASFRATGVSATVGLAAGGLGAFKFSAGSLTGNLSTALAINASNAAFNYDPNAAAGATIATIGSATATITPLAGASLSISNLAVRNNGFSLGDATLTAGALNLGGVVAIAAPTVGLSNVAYTVGSAPTGTITASAASASLFPGNASLTASAKNFAGTYTLGTGALTLKADSAELAAGRIFDAKATGVSLGWDGQNASVGLTSASLTSPLLPGAAATLASFRGDNSGFTIGRADLTAAEAKIGGVLDVRGLDLGVTNLTYSTAGHALSGAFSIATGVGVTLPSGTPTVSILPNATALTSSLTNFAATYDLSSDALAVKADAATIKAGSALEVDATGLAVGLTPAAGGDDSVVVSIQSATATMANEGISGSISGLSITNDGFSLGSATLSHAGATSAFGGKFSIVNPSATLANFGYSTSGGGFTNGGGGSASTSVTLTASEVDFAPTASVTAKATALAATVSFSTTGLGHFTFAAGDVATTIGSYLALDAKNVAFDSAPAAGGLMAQFGSLTATLNAGPLGVSGSARNFAIDAGGNFVAQAGFGVSLNLSDTSKIQWPSWLPIQVQSFSVAWPNFASDPTNFTIVLSASVNASLGGSGVTIGGSITGAVVDTGLLAKGQFPITGLQGAGLSAKGTLFGTTVSASAFFAILDVDSSGNPVPATSTAIASRIFYGGIEGGVSIDGEAGFNLRLGVSSLGPLDAFLEVNSQIILDPASGLAVNDMYAAIDFNASLPSITKASDLATSPAFRAANKIDLPTWESNLGAQVAAQAKNVAGGLAALSGPIKISAGATFYDAYATQNAFSLAGNFAFDTTGKFLISGTLTLGNSVSINAAAYFDMSQANQGKASLLFYAQAPSQAPLATISGSVIVQAGSDLNLDGSTVSASAAVPALGTSSFTVELTSKRLDSNKDEAVASVTGLSLGYDGRNSFVVNYGSLTLTTPDDGAWHAWAAVYDAAGRTLTLYRDGVSVVSRSNVAAANITGTTLRIGTPGAADFHGSVDNVRLWNVARTAAGLASTYNLVDVGASNAGLVGDWAFYAGPTVVAADRSGQGHPMLVSGSPNWIQPADSPFKGDGFTIQIGTSAAPCDVLLAVPGLPGGLDISGFASFQADIADKGLDLSVTGSATINPLGQVGQLAGNVHFDVAGGTPKLYGAIYVGANLSSLPAFANAGLTVSATAYLRFNTTSAQQTAALQLPATPGGALQPPVMVPLPASSFSLYVNGTVGLNNVFTLNAQIYAAFSYATLPNKSIDPELDMEFNGSIAVGASSGPTLNATANGVFIVNSSGLAASMTVGVNAQLPGVSIASNLALTINTSGADQSFSVPAIQDPTQAAGTYLVGTGQTYSVPGVYRIAGVAQTSGGYLALVGSGAISVENQFTLTGGYDLLVTSSMFRLDVNRMTLSVPGLSGFNLAVSGGLVIGSAGIAGAISTSLSAGSSDPVSDSKGLYQIDGTFTFEVNTTSSAQVLGGISVPAASAMLSVAGDVKVGPAGAQFDVSASVTIAVTPSGVSLSLYGTASLGSLGTLSVGSQASPSTLTISPSGLSGNLTLSGSLTPIAGTSLTGTIQLVFDTANGVYKVHVGGDPNVSKSHADLTIGGGAFDLQGAFDLLINPSGFTVGGSFNVTVLHATLGSGKFYASIYKDSDGSEEFALYAGLTLSAGTSLAGLNFSISASPSLTVNTGSTDRPYTFADGTSVDMAPQTAQFRLDNASVSAFGFTASGSLIATITGGGFDIQIPRSNPISLSFLGLGAMQIYGDFNSNGTFSITGQVGYDVKLGPFELYGGIGATISSTGFSAWFNGGANLDCGALGTVNLASVGASITLQSTYVEIAAHLKVLGIGFSFDTSLGGYSPPAHAPGLAFYNVPTTAGAGSVPTFAAQVYDNSSQTNANPVTNDGSYYWVVTGPNYSRTSYSRSFSPTLGFAGSYNVALYANQGSGLVLEKQSTINVVQQTPIISSLNLSNSVLLNTDGTATPLVMAPIIQAANPDNLSGTWTVRNNGTGVTTAYTGLNPTVYLDAVSNSQASIATPPTYTVSFYVNDPYNGPSLTSTATITPLNLYNLTVNSADDDVLTGAASNGSQDLLPKDGKLTLRRAVDLLNDNLFGNISQTPVIHFAPSLAGKSITLVHEASFDYGGYTTGTTGNSILGNDALDANISMIIDGSAAPGLTITQDASADGLSGRRLFAVGTKSNTALLTLKNLILSGGYAAGSGDAAYGGAVYVPSWSSLILNNVAVQGNRAKGGYTGPSTPQSGWGGAIYLASNSSLDARNSTFSGNGAAGTYTTNPTTGAITYIGKGLGGAILVNNAILSLSGDTFSGNSVAGSSALGSGIEVYGPNSSVSIVNTVLSGDVGGVDLYSDPSAPSGVYNGANAGNLIQSSSGAIPAGTLGITGKSALLGLYAARGAGAIPTYSLLPGSPAIDAGSDAAASGLATDARGLARVSGAHVDIGAFEVQPYVVTSTNSTGPGSLAEALATDDDLSSVTFAPGLSTINVAYATTNASGAVTSVTNNGQLTIARSVSIVGPGAGLLTITGANATRLFYVNPGVTASISGVTFANGVGANRAGAIYNAGNLTLTNDVLLNNSAVGDPAHYAFSSDGGAIYNENGATLWIIGDTFAGNLAAGGATASAAYYGSGGAIYNAPTGTIRGWDDTFSGNTAAGNSYISGGVTYYSNGYGGAIHSAGTGLLTNVTMANNAALDGASGAGTSDLSGYVSSGSDLWIDGGSGPNFQLINSIAANSIGGTYTPGSTTNGIYAAGKASPVPGSVTDVTNFGTFTGSRDLVMSSYNLAAGVVLTTADPKLRPLGNYGGPTPTLAPMDGSPAIGAALASAAPGVDQRGYANQNDIGSMQLAYYVVSNASDSGVGSLRQAIASDVDESPITFSSYFSSPRTISLGSTLSLPSDASIVGPGASLLTIQGNGHQIFNVGANVVASITGLTLFGGQSNLGGAIYNAGNLTLNNDSFVGNRAVGTSDPALAGLAGGGALYNATGGSVVVTNSAFWGNSARGASYSSSGAWQIGLARGGAIYAAPSTDGSGKVTMSLVDDTFSGNNATGGDGLAGSYWGQPGYGGAINTFGPTTIVNSTFANDSTGNGSPSPGYANGSDVVIESTGSLAIFNSILASTAAGYDLINSGGSATGAGNLVRTAAGSLAPGLIASSADPLLGTFGNNGGQTPTFAPAPGSPAIGTGQVAYAPTTDQRGLARVVGGAVDIGAYETQVTPVTITSFGPFLYHAGQSVSLGVAVSNPSNSALTYAWTIAGPGGSTITQSTTSPTFSSSAVASWPAGSYAVSVVVSDGYGNNHTVVSPKTSLTFLPILAVGSLIPANAAPAVGAPFASAIFSLNVAPAAATLNQSAVTLFFNGSPVSATNSAGAWMLSIAAVAGQANTYQINGLDAAMARYGAGRYSLTVNGPKITDAYAVPGVGSPTVSWLYDNAAPTSRVAALPATEPGQSFAVSAAGSDPALAGGVAGSGVASYDLLVSDNGAAFAYWTTVPASAPTATFAGVGGHTYAFQSVAHDRAGNLESKPAAAEASSYVPNLATPTTHVTFVDASKQAITVAYSGAAAPGNTLDHVDVLVSVDGGAPMLVGRSAAASGVATYEGIADGRSHAYAFTSLGVDKLGNVQPTPVAADVVVSATFAAPAANAPVSLTVNHGGPSRSFVRYVDLVFDAAAGLSSLISSGKVHLTKYALDGTGGAAVALPAGSLSVVDHAIEVDFGASGLGGSPTTTAGDGYYALTVDGFSDASGNALAYHFDRLYGDVNGDGVVDATDQALVTGALGSSVIGSTVDVDGTGRITTTTSINVSRAKGHKLAAGLSLDA